MSVTNLGNNSDLFGNVPTGGGGGGGGVTAVNVTGPLTKSGSSTSPTIAIPAATTSAPGHMTAAHATAIDANTTAIATKANASDLAAKANASDVTTALATKVNTSALGVASGVATLGPDGLLLAAQRPASSGTTVNRGATRALMKPAGSGNGLVEGLGLGRTIMKVRAPAAFDRVRIWAVNRSSQDANAKFAVAVTEQALNDTVANAYHPRVGNTSYNVAQSSAAPIGWRSGKFAGFDSANMDPSQGFKSGWGPGGSYQAIPDIAVSDWIDCPSVPALDGGLPCLLIRMFVTSASLSGSRWTNGDTIINGSNTFPSGGDITTDFTSLPTAVPGVTVIQLPGFAIEFDFRVKGRSFAFVGDSNTEGYSWNFLAISDVTTADKPYVSANLGMSTHREIEYMANFRQWIKRGYRPTDVVIPSFSHNDFQNVPNKVGFDRQRNRILQALDLCDSIGAKAWIWTHFKGTNQNGDGVSDSTAVEFNNWARALCATGRAELVDIAKDWNGATMLESLKTHFNDTGKDYARGVFKAALIKEGGL